MSNSPGDGDCSTSNDLIEKSPEKGLGAVYSNQLRQANMSQVSDGIRPSARDVLAALSARRIDIGEIEFIGDGLLGKGGMGDVVAATIILEEGSSFESKRTVAVKKLHLGGSGDEEKFLPGFVNELRVVDGLSHPNIIKILGFVEDIKKGIAWLVLPWEANGNVREFLLSGKWELPERVSLIQDVASGLEHLHTRQPPICHGDLKSLNILVKSDHRAVITDFGSARVLRNAPDLGSNTLTDQVASTNHDSSMLNRSTEVALSISDAELTLTGPSWSLRWAAPEVLNDEQPDLASDIWALGWIAWEVVTDNYPFPETKNQNMVTIKVMKGQLPSVYKDDQLSQVHQLCDVMVRCWKAEPKARPSAADCRRALQWIPFIVPRTTQDKVRSAALLMQIGEMNRLQDRYEEASRTLEEGFTIAQSTGDKRTIAGIVLRLGEVHRAQSRTAEAEASYRKALGLYTSIGDDWGRATALLTLGDIHRVRSKYADAVESYTQALEIYGNLGDEWGQATGLLALGDIYRVQSIFAKAVEHYTQALGIHARIGNGSGQANALLGLADIYRVRMAYAEAGDSYTQALEIFTSIGNELGRANVLRGLGDIHQARSQFTQAEDSYKQALNIYTRVGGTMGRGNALTQLGDIHQVRSEHVEAEESYKQALEVFRTIEDNLGQAHVFFGLGNIHEARFKHCDAEDSYTQALAIYTRLGNDVGRANSFLKLSEIRLRQARYAESKALIQDAAQISERLNHIWGKNYSKRLLATVLEAENRLAETQLLTRTLPDMTDEESATASSPLPPSVPCPKLLLLSYMTH
ncbi:hypothetical protein M407DRAFT_31026 [Tulasnella calospora MUT 4182]|uniref:Protein kinase domain-containing protein n=1 Tax=Tulasnella calospora MUT 4182 TaxID=1051891 RepID=A0A0C3Q763_9AGAM|nr:hypothetical protein M407DRAFT_31026 [Tulasnella calospora MUT 4182]